VLGPSDPISVSHNQIFPKISRDQPDKGQKDQKVRKRVDQPNFDNLASTITTPTQVPRHCLGNKGK